MSRRRLSPHLVALGLLLTTLSSGEALADASNRDVPRQVRFGGACEKCDLSGRKLIGCAFTATNFSKASFAGADLRGAEAKAANFTGGPSRRRADRRQLHGYAAG